MENILNKTSIVNEWTKNPLDVFKSQADELTEIANLMPDVYRSEAKRYFYQHCDGLKELLGLEKGYHNEDMKTELDMDEGVSKIKDGMTSDVKGMSEYNIDALIDRRTVCSDVNEAKNVVGSDELMKTSYQEFTNVIGMNKLGKINKDTLEPDGSVNVPSAEKKKRTLYHDDHLEIFCESTHKTGKEQESNAEKRMEAMSESLDKVTEETFDNTIDNRTIIDKLQENIEHDIEIMESGSDIKCDVAELIKCIPKLSQCMDIDPKNVTLLKDDDDGKGDDDKCIYLSVELSDGTVQKFKIAGYIPGTLSHAASEKSGNAKLDKDKTRPGLDQKLHEDAQNVVKRDDAGSDPTIPGRRLRARPYKAPIMRRGPGRPKNENIPAPEKNENGETFYRCEECKATVKSYNALIVHMRTHTGSRPFHCSFCNKSFTTKGNMKAHEMTTHSDNKPWKCEYCSKSFKEKKVLKIHERIHTGERPYSCSICNKAFSQRSGMLEHMFIHSNNRPHLCDYCGQGFRGLSSLKAHKKRHIGPREFQCDSCDREFVCKNELKRHMLTHTGDKPYTCHICSKSFTRHSYLKEHINLHTGARPYTCCVCNLTFSDSMSLHRHKKKHTVGEAGLLQQDVNETNSILSMTTVETKQNLTLEIPEHMTVNGEETSIQVVVDENTSVEDFQKLHSLLLSATGNGELMMSSQDASKHLYQVLCVNPDTQEVLGQVEGQEVIVEGHSEDITEINLQYN